jgi:DNA repair photolyase
LREAKAAGLRTAVAFAPLLPAISDTPRALRGLFNLAAEANVDHIWTDAMNPRPKVWPSVQGFLRRTEPNLVEHYRRLLFDATCRAQYEDELSQRVRSAATQAGVADRLG